MWSAHGRLASLFCQNGFPGVFLPPPPTPFPTPPRQPSPPATLMGPGRSSGDVQTHGMGCAWSQLPNAAQGDTPFLSSSMGRSDWMQVNSRCHPGVFSIIFLGLCRLNSSSATLLCNLGTNPTSTVKLSLCNPYPTCSMSTPPANSSCSQMQRPQVRRHDGFSTAPPFLSLLLRHSL